MLPARLLLNLRKMCSAAMQINYHFGRMGPAALSLPGLTCKAPESQYEYCIPLIEYVRTGVQVSGLLQVVPTVAVSIISKVSPSNQYSLYRSRSSTHSTSTPRSSLISSTLVIFFISPSLSLSPSPSIPPCPLPSHFGSVLPALSSPFNPTST